VVIVRYAGAAAGTGGTVTAGTGSATGYTLHTFTTTGSNSFNLSEANMNQRFGATVTGEISGSGGLVFNGPGRLTLAGTNSYSGGTTLSAGALSVESNAALGSGTVSLGAANLRLGNGVTLANRITLTESAATTTIDQGIAVEYLLVGGGAGGTQLDGSGGGGGGGGNVVMGQTTLAARDSAIQVGAGGARGGNAGQASSLTNSLTTLTAAGGVGGASGHANTPGGTSASTTGDGALPISTSGGAGNATVNRRAGGGGAGAGANGGAAAANIGGRGGDGLGSDITGTLVYYGGGGGGGAELVNGTPTPGAGGLGGGGRGAGNVSGHTGFLAAVAGTANTGGGGGGAGGVANVSSGNNAAAGGSGIVVVRYLGPQIATGGTVTAAAGYTIHSFTSTAASENFSFTMTPTATLDGEIDGTGGFTWSSFGELTLNGVNTYSGGTIISGGRVYAGNASAFGSGAVTLASTGATLGAAANMTLANNVVLSAAGVVDTASHAVSLAGDVSGSGSLAKHGSGTLTLSGANTYSGGTTIAAGTLEVTGVLGGGSYAGAIANEGSLLFNSAANQTLAGAMSGSGALIKRGLGRLDLSGTNTYTGATTVSAGELNVNGSIASSAVTVESGASLSGSGVVGVISGAGSVNPGNSPGILTAPAVNPTGGLSFNFEFTSINPTYSDATASLNDVLRLTDTTTPFVASLTSANAVNIFFNVDALQPNGLYRGAFFTDRKQGFDSLIVDAQLNYYIKDDNGTVSYGGQNYALLGGGFSIIVSTVNQSADFGSGLVDGQITQFEVIPEPSTYALLVLAAAGLAAHTWRQRRRRSGN
jgi:fibronectin-binding autotransporter adhesin